MPDRRSPRRAGDRFADAPAFGTRAARRRDRRSAGRIGRAAENLDVKSVFFRSGAELVPALSTGQIDVASTSPGAALFNAIARGVNAKIVADYWTSGKEHPSGDSAYITVRKDLVADGSFKSARDAKGRTLAITARGQMTELFAEAYLQSAGLDLADVRVVDLPLPDMVAALANKAVDLATTIDPYATLAAQRGIGDKLVPLSAVLPGYVQAVMMFGDRLVKTDRPVGMRFLRATTRRGSTGSTCIGASARRSRRSAELVTARQEGAAFVVIVIHNGIYGSIRMHQERHYPGRVVATDIVAPDFVAYAKAFGAYGERVESTEQFAPAFERALAARGPAVLELPLAPEILTTDATLSAIRERARSEAPAQRAIPSK